MKVPCREGFFLIALDHIHPEATIQLEQYLPHSVSEIKWVKTYKAPLHSIWQYAENYVCYCLGFVLNFVVNLMGGYHLPFYRLGNWGSFTWNSTFAVGRVGIPIQIWFLVLCTHHPGSASEVLGQKRGRNPFFLEQAQNPRMVQHWEWEAGNGVCRSQRVFTFRPAWIWNGSWRSVCFLPSPKTSAHLPIKKCFHDPRKSMDWRLSL